MDLANEKPKADDRGRAHKGTLAIWKVSALIATFLESTARMT